MTAKIFLLVLHPSSSPLLPPIKNFPVFSFLIAAHYFFLATNCSSRDFQVEELEMISMEETRERKDKRSYGFSGALQCGIRVFKCWDSVFLLCDGKDSRDKSRVERISWGCKVSLANFQLFHRF